MVNKIGIVTVLQEEFVKNLKYYRNEKEFSQEKLAEACDCATGTIGDIECGKTLPSFEMIANIAAAHSLKGLLKDGCRESVSKLGKSQIFVYSITYALFIL